MAKNFIRIAGWPAAPAVARALAQLLAAHRRELGYDLGVNSIYRTRSEQITIFTQRYRRNGLSPYGDYRTFDGSRWGRISGLGPVASPDVVSNHTRGFAVDFAVSKGTASWRWLVANAHKYGFNNIEGASIGEPWHWCWKVGIFPTSYTPDPWEGRGAPDPVYPTDQGLSLSGSAAGAGGGAADDEEEWLMAAADDIAFIKDQLGGSSKREQSLRSDVDDLAKSLAALTKVVGTILEAATWTKDRVGGTTKGGASLTSEIRALKK